jgi:transcriptional regulatory protein RtcR
MSREARERFLEFAKSPAAVWPGNFRDFNGAVLRMATLAPGGRITMDVVNLEIERLTATWRRGQADDGDGILERLMPDRLEEVDLFDRVQLEAVVRVCRGAPSLSSRPPLVRRVAIAEGGAE